MARQGPAPAGPVLPAAMLLAVSYYLGLVSVLIAAATYPHARYVVPSGVFLPPLLLLLAFREWTLIRDAEALRAIHPHRAAPCLQSPKPQSRGSMPLARTPMARSRKIATWGRLPTCQNSGRLAICPTFPCRNITGTGDPGPERDHA